MLKKPLFLIFLLALAIRFLYFPADIYFAFDQARDSLIALEILKGNLKILGPPSAASSQLFAGALLYYIYAPIYFFFNDPQAVAAIFRIYNSLGVILIFLITTSLFSKRTALIATLLFALSYEQSQYSLFLSHQALATISILLFYYGLSLLIFKKNQKGLSLAALGAGLSIQFHYLYTFLILPFSFLLLLFRKNIKIKPKTILLSITVLLLTTSTYLLAELKFGFKFLRFLTSPSTTQLHLQETISAVSRLLRDNFLAIEPLTPILWLSFILLFYFLITNKKLRPKAIFLLTWFATSLIPYLLSGTPSYYYAASATVSLQIAISYIVFKLFSQKPAISFILILIIIVSNLHLITSINPTGVNSNFIIQPNMLLSEEKRALDYIYSETKGQPFAIKALTIPLNIKTTWDFLFTTYGQNKYGYTPVWIGPTAEGFPGSLPVISARSDLPPLQFLIIEPTVGIHEHDKETFFQEESYFTRPIEEKTFNTLTVQKREVI